MSVKQHKITIDGIKYKTILDPNQSESCKGCVFAGSLPTCKPTNFLCVNYNNIDKKYRIWIKDVNKKNSAKRCPTSGRFMSKKKTIPAPGVDIYGNDPHSSSFSSEHKNNVKQNEASILVVKGLIKQIAWCGGMQAGVGSLCYQAIAELDKIQLV